MEYKGHFVTFGVRRSQEIISTSESEVAGAKNFVLPDDLFRGCRKIRLETFQILR